jgi:ApbE superfamily uncharacterized protein (UPF0280 family)
MLPRVKSGRSASVGAPFAVTLLACGAAEVVAVAFQIVELTPRMGRIERRVVPYPYATHQEAVTAIECIVSTFGEASYEPEGDFWWATAGNGETRVRFIIEGV